MDFHSAPPSPSARTERLSNVIKAFSDFGLVTQIRRNKIEKVKPSLALTV